MKFEQHLIDLTIEAIHSIFGIEIEAKLVSVQKTNLIYRNEGDFTIVVFPFTRFSKKSPEETAQMLGDYLAAHSEIIESYGVVKGFLNLRILSKYWVGMIQKEAEETALPVDNREKILIEFSSPNTNKPLHLGHIRNNLLGWSVSEILKANGHDVVRVNLVNDRGIHICKSMLAWEKWGKGETPESSGIKGDHLAGKYYVLFDQYYKEEIKSLIASGLTEEEAKQQAPLMQEAREMLKKWEDNDAEVMQLWNTMNGWVYEGFDVTYKQMGISFDKTYYESQTWQKGKSLVEDALKNGNCYQKDDQSVWVDLTAEGLDEKILLRSDGTSVYMTQDLGTAYIRHNEHQPKQMIYVVGNEQNYHFDVLKLVLQKKFGFQWAESIFHLSYGMVELPEGKMKSREGTVVDADDLMEVMIQTAQTTTEELGKTLNFDLDEQTQLYQVLAMGALKYFILKVDPVKNIVFNPAESIDFNGHTGPFIQYTHARICSLMKKAGESETASNPFSSQTPITQKERQLIQLLYEYPAVVQEAGQRLSPALIANYAFELAKEYNQFYHESPVLKESDADIRQMRLGISAFTAGIIKSAMHLLGIEVPERM
ncbi:MAG: arginine--tRNA ligase [Bacteroidota bacterium]